MSENTIVCKCEFCLEKNENGVLLSISTYNRHRKNQQEFLEKDDVKETSLSYQQDIHQQEGIYQQDQQEDIYQQDTYQQKIINQQEDNPIIVDENSDTESFNFDKESNNDYSDYSDNNGNNNKNDDDDNDDDNDNDDDDDDDENEVNDDDAMQIDNDSNTPNKKIIDGLKLLYLKSLYNFTESAYDDIMKIFIIERISLYKVKKYLKEVTGLVPVFYDMCENSYICYTGQYEFYQTCPMCLSTRLDAKGKAKKVMPYLSIKNRLKIQFNDENRVKEFLYHHEYIINKETDDNDDLNDIFDGNIYKELVEENLFNDKRDIAFTASCDEYQIFKQKTDDCWLFLMINNNLDPSLRVKKENLMIPFLIPGPNQPKDFNTFLQPFVNKMKELESKYIV